MASETRIAWSNTASYVSSGFTTNPSYAVTEYSKQLAEVAFTTSANYVVDFIGNVVYVKNCDADTVRLQISGAEATVIDENTTLTVTTDYESVVVEDGVSLSISDGASLTLSDGTYTYDSGYVDMIDDKIFRLNNNIVGTATLTFTNVSYLGLVFTGLFESYGEPEYPINDIQQDFGFRKRTINGTSLYTPNYISNDLSFNLFSTLTQYKELRKDQRRNRNTILCLVSTDTAEEYYVRYGFMDIINGTETRGQYYNTSIKIEGV